MLLEEKILTIIEKDSSQLQLSYHNKKDYVLELYNDEYQEYFKFAQVNNGNSMYTEKDIFPEYYEKVFNASNKDIYNKIMEAYNENIDFLNKYKVEINKIKNVTVSMGDMFFYYNKRSEILYLIPIIKLRTISAYFYIDLSPKLLSKIDVLIDKVYDEFYSHVFQNFLEKPLNKYTPEELTIFNMIKI